MAPGIRSQMAHQAKLTDALQKVDCFFGNFNQRYSVKQYKILMNLKTLCVGLNTNKQMVGEYEDVSNKHTEGADRSINPRV